MENTYYWNVTETSSSGSVSGLYAVPMASTSDLAPQDFANLLLRQHNAPSSTQDDPPVKVRVEVWTSRPDPVLPADPDAVAEWPDAVPLWTDEE